MQFDDGPDSAYRFQPGQTQTIHFKVISSFRQQQISGTIGLDPNTESPFTSVPDAVPFSVPPQGSVRVALDLTCVAGTPLGKVDDVTFKLTSSVQTFDFLAQAVIFADRVVTVTANPTDLTLVAPTTAQVQLLITATGGSADVLVTPEAHLPIGVSPGQQTVSVNGSTTVTITLTVGGKGPDLFDDDPRPLLFHWFVAADDNHPQAVSGSVTLNITVPHQQIVFDTGSLTAETVHDWGQLALDSAGRWAFRGHVHDNGFIGDNYILAIGLRPVDETNQDVLYVHNEGTLGGTLSSASRDDDWDAPRQSGVDARIADHWDIIKQRGVSGFLGRLHAATDPSQVLTIVELLAAIGVVTTFGVLVATGVCEIKWGPKVVPGSGGAQEGVGVALFTITCGG